MSNWPPEVSRFFRPSVPLWQVRLYEEMLTGLAWRPLFHLLMIVGPEEGIIGQVRVTLRSLERQSYPNWRLLVVRRSGTHFCELTERLASGTETIPHSRRAVSRARDAEKVLLTELCGISEGVAERIVLLPRKVGRRLAELARERTPLGAASFLGLLSPGDLLSGDCLAEFALQSGLHRDTDFLYSDEERRNCRTGQVEPFCKPDWSPDLMLSTNYIGRFWCADMALMERTGTTLEEVLRYGEYDYVLRLTERATSIRHVREVLCRPSDEPCEPEEREREALDRALSRRGIDGEVGPGRVSHSYRIKRRLTERPPVSIILPTGGNLAVLRKCIDGLFEKTDYRDFELIILFNTSTRPEAFPYLDTVARDKRVAIIDSKGPFNYSRICNIGTAAASHAILLYLNDDVEAIHPAWLGILVAEVLRPEVGVVGPQLLYPNGTVQHAGVFLVPPIYSRHAFRHNDQNDPGYFGLALTQRNVTAMTGACLLTRRDVFDRVGGYEEAHDIINNDVDFCLKARRLGLLCVYTPHTSLIHHERATRQQAPDDFDDALFEAEWRSTYARGDPYHAPRLAIDQDDIAVSPEEVQVSGSGCPLFEREGISRILILNFDSMAENIKAIPAVRQLKKVFSRARIVMLCSRETVQIWSMLTEIDEVMSLDILGATAGSPQMSWLEREANGDIRDRLEQSQFDLAIDFDRFAGSRPLLRHAGARYTAGYDTESRFPWLDISINYDPSLFKATKPEIAAEPHRTLVAAIAAATEAQHDILILPARASEISLSSGLFERSVVAVHAGAPTRSRQWPAVHFAELMDWLIEEKGVNVALVGTDADVSASNAVIEQTRNRDHVCSRVGVLQLDELAKFLSHCSLVIGNTDGACYMAAALGVPTVSVHSTTVDRREWAPVGPRGLGILRKTTRPPPNLSRAHDSPRGVVCVTELRPADLYPLCERLLAIGWGKRA